MNRHRPTGCGLRRGRRQIMAIPAVTMMAAPASSAAARSRPAARVDRQ